MWISLVLSLMALLLSLMTLFNSRIPARMPHYVESSCLLSRLWQCFNLSLLFMTLTVLRGTVEVFCRIFLSWGFPLVILRWCIWGKNTIEKCPYHRISVITLYPYDLLLMVFKSVWSPGQSHVCLVFPVFLPFPYVVLWKQVIKSSPYSLVGNGAVLSFTCWRESVYHVLSGILLKRFVPFLPLFIQPFIYTSMDLCIFILCFGLWLNLSCLLFCSNYFSFRH